MPITTDVVLDTNILLRIPYDQSSEQTEASRAYITLLRRGFVAGTTIGNLAEFANTATRPVTANGLGLRPNQAQHRILAFENQLALFSESLPSYEVWKQLVAKYDVRGKQVHDARIVAIIGIRSILTFNTLDFRRFPKIVTLHPDDVLAQT